MGQRNRCTSPRRLRFAPFPTFPAGFAHSVVSPLFLLDNCRPLISEIVPDDELAAVAATIRRAIEDDKFPHAPRLDPLKAALARLAAAGESVQNLETLPRKAPPAGKGRQAGAAIRR
jgi:hypothetical protein